jgi:hypothetical protein
LTDGDIEIRFPTPDDLPAIGELYRAVKGRGRPDSVTRHRFFDTPWGDSPAFIALDGDKCVSVGLVWPVALRVGDEVVLGGQGPMRPPIPTIATAHDSSSAWRTG